MKELRSHFWGGGRLIDMFAKSLDRLVNKQVFK